MYHFVYHFQVFLLIMMRMNAMIIIAPFFSSDLIPFRVKALVSFLITMVIFPMVAAKGYRLPGDMGGYFLLVIQEVAIGLFIGFLVSVIFAGFQLSGQFFAVQIGFGINEVLDPIGQVSVPLVGQFKNIIGLLVLLAMNGHHMMLQGVYRSYELAPIMGADKAFLGGLMKYMLHAFSGMFVVALKIAFPIVAIVFVVTVSMGILAKVAPQMNIMMLGFPFKIAVSFIVMLVITPMIVKIMWVSLERAFAFMFKILRYWPG
ncbi:MAG: flagellar type III secretion system protein FliR [Chrysiogenales bacterium]|nr:MAG: flagellar type III secretion system protein FliR [Chrysiogenales bacterium]